VGVGAMSVTLIQPDVAIGGPSGDRPTWACAHSAAWACCHSVPSARSAVTRSAATLTIRADPAPAYSGGQLGPDAEQPDRPPRAVLVPGHLPEGGHRGLGECAGLAGRLGQHDAVGPGQEA